MNPPPYNPKTEVEHESAALERLVHAEIRKQEQSPYWRGLVTPPIASQDDFDRKKMVEDYARQFPALSRDAIASLIDQKICLLHLR